MCQSFAFGCEYLEGVLLVILFVVFLCLEGLLVLHMLWNLENKGHNICALKKVVHGERFSYRFVSGMTSTVMVFGSFLMLSCPMYFL